MAPENEHALILRCQQGDLAAFEELYRRYAPRLLATAWRLLDTREDAEDAVQEAMLRAWRGIGRFRRDAAFGTWLCRIVINASYDRLQGRRRAAHVDVEEIGEIPAEDDAELRVQLRQAIAGLPPRMKACFVLFAQEGFKQREIAEMLGLKEGTVKVQVFEAKARLREALAARLRGWTA
jgi:RNA polymerase sigma-70 factor (ECF subfamily)